MPRRMPENPPPLCKLCRRAIDWSTIRTSDREVQPGVFERAYICPHCRSVQEFASWQTRHRETETQRRMGGLG